MDALRCPPSFPIFNTTNSNTTSLIGQPYVALTSGDRDGSYGNVRGVETEQEGRTVWLDSRIGFAG